MRDTYCCWNCCGLRKETDEFDPICPNCGCGMDKPGWDICDVMVLGGLEIVGEGEFIHIGSLLSDESSLLSYAVNRHYVELALEKPNIAGLFVRPEDAPDAPPFTLVLSGDPRADFFEYHNHLIKEARFYGNSYRSEIAKGEDGASLSSSTFISYWDVIIKENVSVGPNVTIFPNTHVGVGTVIEAGAVIGMDGARLIQRADGSCFQALHAGGVRIGKNVTIRANAVIMRSVWSRPTVIGDGAYIGNLVNVGHNCRVGREAVILPGAILCGRAEIGPRATVAPGAIVSDGVRVGEGAHVTIGAVVTRDVPPGERVSGNFAVPHDKLIAHVKELAREEKENERERVVTCFDGHADLGTGGTVWRVAAASDNRVC